MRPRPLPPTARRSARPWRSSAVRVVASTLVVGLLVAAGACADDDEDLAPDAVPPAVATDAVPLSTAVDAAPGTPATTSVASPAVFTPGPCLPDFDGSVLPVECGTVVVPQNRLDGSRGVVELAVAVIDGTDDEAATPIVYLPGGPGDSALTTLAGLLRDDETSAIFGPRDWVVFDPRGTGASEPRVGCPDAGDVPADEQVAAAQACAAALVRRGIDLTTYNTTTLAADATDVRRALGIASWDVYAVSYGTRVALQLMRSDGAGLRSVVLDGPYPTTQGFNDSLDERPTAAFEQLFADCAADAACARAFPDLRNRVIDMVARLNVEPVEADDFRVTGDFALMVAARALYQYTPGQFLAPVVPLALSTAADGDLTHLVELARVNFGGEPNSAGTSEDDTTIGMGRAVQCHDEIPFLDRELAREQEAAFPFGAVQARFDGDVEFDICDVFGAGVADPSFRDAVTSTIPTLVLTGTYDPTTPTAWADETVATLARAQLVRFPGVGHIVITTGLCPVQMIQRFLADPTATVDRSCVDAYGPEFDTGVAP